MSWGLTLQRGRVGSSRYPVGLGVRVGVVRSHPKPGEKRGKHTEALQIREFDASHVRVRSVDDRTRRAWQWARGAQRTGDIEIRRVVDRIDELLVEESGLNHAIRLQVVLVQNIEVVGVLRLEIGVPIGNGEGISRLVHEGVRNQVVRIGA